MEYKEIIFNSRTEASDFIKDINEKALSPLEWTNSDAIQLYRCFQPSITIDCLFVYGETITPSQIAKLPKIGIFANIKSYGSSKKYKGLRNIKGETLLNTYYDDLTLFFQTEGEVYIKTSRDGLFGLVSYRHLSNKVNVLLQPQYEEIFDAGEFTFGIVKSGKVGFVSLAGREIIEAKYKLDESYNHFSEGKALVCLDNEFAIAHYINHYGECVAIEDETSDNLFSGNGTGYYPFGELPDASDAYEGDESNRWNTD